MQERNMERLNSFIEAALNAYELAVGLKPEAVGGVLQVYFPEAIRYLKGKKDDRDQTHVRDRGGSAGRDEGPAERQPDIFGNDCTGSGDYDQLDLFGRGCTCEGFGDDRSLRRCDWCASQFNAKHGEARTRAPEEEYRFWLGAGDDDDKGR
jgi:hypothetical protein